ncbi:MAG: HNH endonuclease [Planctomycetota bacterium]
MNSYTDKAKFDLIDRECHSLWRRIVLLRAGCRCEICGAPSPEDRRKGRTVIVDPCHIISKRYWSTRWDTRNGIAGCRNKCHNEKVIMDWLYENDRERWEWVIKMRGTQVPNREVDIEEILRKLREAA